MKIDGFEIRDDQAEADRYLRRRAALRAAVERAALQLQDKAAALVLVEAYNEMFPGWMLDELARQMKSS